MDERGPRFSVTYPPYGCISPFLVMLSFIYQKKEELSIKSQFLTLHTFSFTLPPDFIRYIVPTDIGLP